MSFIRYVFFLDSIYQSMVVDGWQCDPCHYVIFFLLMVSIFCFYPLQFSVKAVVYNDVNMYIEYVFKVQSTFSLSITYESYKNIVQYPYP